MTWVTVASFLGILFSCLGILWGIVNKTIYTRLDAIEGGNFMSQQDVKTTVKEHNHFIQEDIAEIKGSIARIENYLFYNRPTISKE